MERHQQPDRKKPRTLAPTASPSASTSATRLFVPLAPLSTTENGHTAPAPATASKPRARPAAEPAAAPPLATPVPSVQNWLSANGPAEGLDAFDALDSVFREYQQSVGGAGAGAGAAVSASPAGAVFEATAPRESPGGEAPPAPGSTTSTEKKKPRRNMSELQRVNNRLSAKKSREKAKERSEFLEGRCEDLEVENRAMKTLLERRLKGDVGWRAELQKLVEEERREYRGGGFEDGGQK